MTSTCQQVQQQIAGYVDHELEPAQLQTVSGHLQACPGCAEAANAQKKIKNLVREKAAALTTPAPLRAAIRRSLARENSGFSFWAQVQQLFTLQPLPALAAVAALIFFSGLLTYFAFFPSAPLAGGNPAFVAGSLEGEIICIDCDLLDSLKTAHGHDAAHRVGVRCLDGRLWSILRSEKSETLASQIHRRVRVVGNLFEKMHYVEIREFSFI